jgi:hypothetical protein
MVSADDLRLTGADSAASTSMATGLVAGAFARFSGRVGSGAVAFALPRIEDAVLTVLAVLVRAARAAAEVGRGTGGFGSADVLRGVTFFAAVDAVDIVERSETLERVEWFEAEETERCTDNPCLMVASAVVGVRREGVTRRDRTDEATDCRLDVALGVDGTDCEGRGGARSRTLLADELVREEVRTRTEAGEAEVVAAVEAADASGAASEASEAVLKAVEASLVVDAFDVGRTAAVRTVEARERTECMDAAEDLGVDVDESAGGVTMGGGGGLRVGAADDRALLSVDVRSAADRKDGAKEEAEEVGVSFESGRGSTLRRVEVTWLRDVVEWVLRAADRMEDASDASLGVALLGLGDRTTLPARVECMLMVSLSSGLFVTRSPPADACNDDLESGLPGTNSSSIGTSISEGVMSGISRAVFTNTYHD